MEWYTRALVFPAGLFPVERFPVSHIEGSGDSLPRVCRADVAWSRFPEDDQQAEKWQTAASTNSRSGIPDPWPFTLRFTIRPATGMTGA
jgi:hypothetical protein